MDIPIEPIVFSEVQISGETADDEFIELYNPLDHDIDLTGYSIKKLTDNNLEKKTNLVSDDNISGKIIQSHGYFLIVHAKEGSINQYKGTTSPDLYFNSSSYSIVPNNTLILYDSLNREIDRIGWTNNEAVDPICEGDCLLNINDFQSFERKAKSSSTKDLMQDGLDKTFGNSFDSNNNIQDFIIRDIPEPQNSFSIKEPYTPENISELIIQTPTGFTAVLNTQDKTMDFT
ncbi:MAG TPA: lamin tail domain-containing protein [Candidatus Paceibacterota bacterium]|nr:lamin tail domain-containing protein [Candidatus Paceibacterota bacterium]